MTYRFTNLPLAIVLIFSFFMHSCASKKESATQLPTIPGLLNRTEQTQMGKEWENTQNAYVFARQKIFDSPHQHEGYQKLAEIFMNEARITGEHGHYYPAALEVLKLMMKNCPEDHHDSPVGLVTMANVYLSLHQFPKALELALEARPKLPYYAQVYGVLVDAYVELGRYEEAVEAADKMIRLRPDLRSYSRVSYLREIHGDVPGAIEALEMAVKAGVPHQESTAWARLTLAELHTRYGHNTEAKALYKQILKDRPDYPFALAGLADLYIEEHRLSEGKKLLDQAIEAIPEVGFYMQKIRIAQAQNDLHQVEDLKNEVLEMLKDDVENGHLMDMTYADLYLLLDQPNLALNYAMKEIDQRPENIDVNLLMGRVMEALGSTEAEIYFQRASRTGSQHPRLAGL